MRVFNEGKGGVRARLEALCYGSEKRVSEVIGKLIDHHRIWVDGPPFAHPGSVSDGVRYHFHTAPHGSTPFRGCHEKWPAAPSPD